MRMRPRPSEMRPCPQDSRMSEDDFSASSGRAFDLSRPRKHSRRRLDETWVTANGEVLPFKYIKSDHLLNIGRRLERDAKKRFDERVKKTQEMIQTGRISSAERHDLEEQIKDWQKLSTIERTADAFPKYESFRNHAIGRGILEQDETFARAIDRSKPKRRKRRRGRIR